MRTYFRFVLLALLLALLLLILGGCTWGRASLTLSTQLDPHTTLSYTWDSP